MPSRTEIAGPADEDVAEARRQQRKARTRIRRAQESQSDVQARQEEKVEPVRDSGAGKKPNLRLRCVAKPLGSVLQHEEQRRRLSSAERVSVDEGRDPERAEPVEHG